MHYLIWALAAVLGWYAGGMNLAITISRKIYHQDIRELGSGNPGFTNFKRVFGNRYAWFVFAFDLLKGAAMCGLFGIAFRALGYDYQLGAAFTGIFVLLGHSFPLQYKLKGGKGFLVLQSELFILDWRIGVASFVLMALLLLITKYMSVATLCGLTLGAVLLFITGSQTAAAAIFAVCVIFVIYRHKENIQRLLSGTENKFAFRSHS